MCRSIKTLRPPFVEQLTEQDVQAAALQYVRKVSGFRKPAAHNAAAFDKAVETITAATAELLEVLEVRGSRGNQPAHEPVEPASNASRERFASGPPK